ncbi:MAG: hypothetical protein INR66_22670, partial [Gordonia polyisoprenivorans]|nr:hypothetical protein [Gordonia polyisoprenivorans]
MSTTTETDRADRQEHPARPDRADALTLVRTQSAAMPARMRAIADAVLDAPAAAANGSAADLA